MPRSDGYKNLKSWKERTPDERRLITQKAGIASGEKRRETKAARDYLMLIHSTPMNAMQKKKSKCLGEVDEADLNQYLAEVLELHRQALKGNVKAMELILKMRGHMPAEKTEITGANGAPLMAQPFVNFTVTAEQANDLIDKAFANEAANAEP